MGWASGLSNTNPTADDVKPNYVISQLSSSMANPWRSSANTMASRSARVHQLVSEQLPDLPSPTLPTEEAAEVADPTDPQHHHLPMSNQPTISAHPSRSSKISSLHIHNPNPNRSKLIRSGNLYSNKADPINQRSNPQQISQQQGHSHISEGMDHTKMLSAMMGQMKVINQQISQLKMTGSTPLPPSPHQSQGERAKCSEGFQKFHHQHSSNYQHHRGHESSHKNGHYQSLAEEEKITQQTRSHGNPHQGQDLWSSRSDAYQDQHKSFRSEHQLQIATISLLYAMNLASYFEDEIKLGPKPTVDSNGVEVGHILARDVASKGEDLEWENSALKRPTPTNCSNQPNPTANPPNLPETTKQGTISIMKQLGIYIEHLLKVETPKHHDKLDRHLEILRKMDEDVKNGRMTEILSLVAIHASLQLEDGPQGNWEISGCILRPLPMTQLPITRPPPEPPPKPLPSTPPRPPTKPPPKPPRPLHKTPPPPHPLSFVYLDFLQIKFKFSQNLFLYSFSKPTVRDSPINPATKFSETNDQTRGVHSKIPSIECQGIISIIHRNCAAKSFCLTTNWNHIAPPFEDRSLLHCLCEDGAIEGEQSSMAAASRNKLNSIPMPSVIFASNSTEIGKKRSEALCQTSDRHSHHSKGSPQNIAPTKKSQPATITKAINVKEFPSTTSTSNKIPVHNNSSKADSTKIQQIPQHKLRFQRGKYFTFKKGPLGRTMKKKAILVLRSRDEIDLKGGGLIDSLWNTCNSHASLAIGISHQPLRAPFPFNCWLL